MPHSLITSEKINEFNRGTIVEHLGIEITEVDGQTIKGKMPVDHRTVQSLKYLHGGASVVLAETLGSIGATMQIDFPKEICLGIEINANHIKSVKSGYVYGIASPIQIGKNIHVWEIKIRDESNDLICVSRLTLAVIKNQPLS